MGSGNIVSRQLCMRLSHRLGICYRVHIHVLNWNSMPLGIPLINVIHLAFSYLYIWLALLIA